MGAHSSGGVGGVAPLPLRGRGWGRGGERGETLQAAAFLARSRANGPGLRSVLWVQGCPRRCPGCFNPDFLPFTGGRAVPIAEVADWMLAEPRTEGISLSGGEPFAQAAPLAVLAERVRAAGKGVVIFTGLTATALGSGADPDTRRLLAAADLLVAGPYRQDRPTRHPLLASANQALIYLTDRYRGTDLGRRRGEVRIGVDGDMTVTGLAPPSPPAPPPEGEGGAPTHGSAHPEPPLPSPLPPGGGVGGEGGEGWMSHHRRRTP